MCRLFGQREKLSAICNSVVRSLGILGQSLFLWFSVPGRGLELKLNWYGLTASHGEYIYLAADRTEQTHNTLSVIAGIALFSIL